MRAHLSRFFRPEHLRSRLASAYAAALSSVLVLYGLSFLAQGGLVPGRVASSGALFWALEVAWWSLWLGLRRVWGQPALLLAHFGLLVLSTLAVMQNNSLTQTAFGGDILARASTNYGLVFAQAFLGGWVWGFPAAGVFCVLTLTGASASTVGIVSSNALLYAFIGGAIHLLLGRLERVHAALSDSHGQLEDANRELERLSRTDPLTGLGNRRALEALLERDAAFGSLSAWDLDLLKKVNDAHGHAAGDGYILDFVRAARAELGEDALFRLGGDEFVTLHREATPEAALERVRARFPGVSVGWAAFKGRAYVLALREADAVMYADKARRRGARAAVGT